MNKSLIAASVLLMSMTAFANEEGMGAKGEVNAEAQAAFSALDANGDGAITPDEVQADPELMTRFDEIDADGNGAITLEEYTDHLAR
ncbi:EF-hand domain-containing protein [Nitrincola sp. MINF-07-Sa-05]|uniref:EF-hand domain-containing protein n=1 Tax=Nitrincola salilacus TaxID=3400273 RepID=UPI0039185FAA